jgi:lipid-binding SYLF domain-containing protein
MVVVTSLVLSSAAVIAADVSSSQAKRLQDAATVVREIKGAPDKGIPEDLWNKAECVSVIPHLKKGAFVVGGEYGKGVMSCRHDGAWSAPVFIEMAKGSAGWQIGGEQVDLVLLVMNRGGMEKMLQDKVNLGADAAVAAGPVGRAASASTDAQLHAGILAYSRAEGAFAGVDVSGGVLRPDKDANEQAYGASAEPRRVLESGSTPVPEAAKVFVRSLGSESRSASVRK